MGAFRGKKAGAAESGICPKKDITGKKRGDLHPDSLDKGGESKP